MAGQRASGRDGKATSAARQRPLTWKLLLRHAVAVAVAGLVIYLLLPTLTRMAASWPRLANLAPAWMIAALAAEVASFACYFALQRLALRTSAWFPVVTAGLTGNAVSGILPAGSAAGATLQFEMLQFCDRISLMMDGLLQGIAGQVHAGVSAQLVAVCDR